MTKKPNQKSQDKESTDATTILVTKSALENFEEFITTNKDASEFMEISKLTGAVQDTLTEYQKREWLSRFEQWKKLGKPRPQMPQMPKSSVKYTTAVYRIRDRGHDKVYEYLSDGSVFGKTEEKVYEEIENPLIPGQMVSTGHVLNIITIYDRNFTDEMGQKILDEAEKVNPPHQPIQLYFMFNGLKRSISAANFTKPYDELVDKINKKQPLN